VRRARARPGRRRRRVPACQDLGVLAGPPDRAVVPPRAVLELAAGARVAAVWENAFGGLTFTVGDAADRRFVKWVPVDHAGRLAAEMVRLQWARHYTPVPPVLGDGRDEDGAWLVTAALTGDSAVAPRWKREPAVAVRAIGSGLRAFHDALPVADCPFSWSIDDRLADVQRRHATGAIDRSGWHDVHRDLPIDEAIAIAAAGRRPSDEELVVCHGDACAPNTLLDGSGAWTGHVDLGALGVADRWADLAVATWSCEWNYGPGWDALLLDGYGIEPDPTRIAYYRLLWDLGD